MSIYKCLLVGDGGTGKTSLIKRLITDEFVSSYSATIGYEVHRLIIHSVAQLNGLSDLTLHVWDISGQSESGFLLSEILSNAHCAIIIFDVTSRITFNNVSIWYRDIINANNPDIPIVVVGNKIDIPARKVKTEILMRRLPRNTQYCNISVKMKLNIEEPFKWIAAQLLKRSHVEMITEPTFESMDIKISEKHNEEATAQELVENLPIEKNVRDFIRKKNRRKNQSSKSSQEKKINHPNQ